MKILLIHPPTPIETIGEDFYFMEPLALEYWGAVLSTHHTVNLLDLRIEQKIDTHLKEFEPNLVVIYALIYHTCIVKDLAGKIKSCSPNVSIIVTCPYDMIISKVFIDTHIDAVCTRSTPEVINYLCQNSIKPDEWRHLEGVVTKQSMDKHHSLNVNIHQIEAPIPDRSLTKLIRNQYYCEWFKPIAVVRVARGGAFRCDVGSHWKEYPSEKSMRSIEDIITEIHTIKESQIYFTDGLLFKINKSYEELFENLKAIQLKKHYILPMDASTILNNPDILKKGKQAGIVRIFIEMEYNRTNEHPEGYLKMQFERNSEILNRLGQNKISCHANFTIHSDYTEHDFDALVKYVNQLNIKSPRFYVKTPNPAHKDDITQNPAFYDHYHALLPTELSITRFSRELYFLYNRTIIPQNRESLAERSNPEIIWAYHKFLKKIKNSYRYMIAE